MGNYSEIFKRKSFHLFKDTEAISNSELEEILAFVKTITPLDSSIKTEIRIVPESETTCKRGSQYCIEFYSEEKGNYLRNIGYIGEQIDLYLTSRNIGTLWFGIGKPDLQEVDGLPFIIMIAFAKVPETSFRKDMFKAKRKAEEEVWHGSSMEGTSDIVRFSPSACNTQPWIVENTGDSLLVYRYKKSGKRGIMPADKVLFYNRIDIGIFLFILETCLSHNNYDFDATQYFEDTQDSAEKTLVARYLLKRRIG